MSLIVAGLVIPNIMLSALVFSWMIREGSNRHEGSKAEHLLSD
jgi:hypothetical protein